MAIDLTLKSVSLTNRDATPRVFNNPGLGHGATTRVAYGHIASVPASLSITSIIRFVEVPSNCIVSEVSMQSAAQTAGAFDIGVARTTADGGALVSQNLFGSAITAAAAMAANITNESGNYTLPNQGKRLWEAAGMTADPKSMLDIVGVVTTTDVTTGTGAMSLRVGYIDNG